MDQNNNMHRLTFIKYITGLGALVFCGLFSACRWKEPMQTVDRRTSIQPPLKAIMIDLQSIADVGQIDAHRLNGYFLSLKKQDPECSSIDDIEGTHDWFQGKIVHTISSNCSWVISLRLGRMKKGSSQLDEVYFQNIGTNSKGQTIGLDGDQGSNLVDLKLRLRLTKVGWDAGYGRLLADFIQKRKDQRNKRKKRNSSGSSNDANMAGDFWDGDRQVRIIGSGAPGSSDASDVDSTSNSSENNGDDDNDGWLDIGIDIQRSSPRDTGRLVVYKGTKEKGVKFPVKWLHTSHGLEVFSKPGKKKESSYADLWLAKELTQSFKAIAELPFNVKGVSKMGIYSYRKISGSSKISRHSFALAADIFGFILKDGTEVSIKKNWKTGPYRSLLRSIRDQFCLRFDVVLSPDYNKAHYDHLHVDLNPKKRRLREDRSLAWSDLSLEPFTMLSLLSFSQPDESSLASHAGEWGADEFGRQYLLGIDRASSSQRIRGRTCR